MAVCRRPISAGYLGLRAQIRLDHVESPEPTWLYSGSFDDTVPSGIDVRSTEWALLWAPAGSWARPVDRTSPPVGTWFAGDDSGEPWVLSGSVPRRAFD
jgi:hypothetical protein